MSHATTASPNSSFRAPWKVSDAVDSRGNAGWTTLKSGHPCPCRNCSQRFPAEKTGRSLLNRPSCRPDNPIGHLTELNFLKRQWTEWTDPKDHFNPWSSQFVTFCNTAVFIVLTPKAPVSWYQRPYETIELFLHPLCYRSWFCLGLQGNGEPMQKASSGYASICVSTHLYFSSCCCFDWPRSADGLTLNANSDQRFFDELYYSKCRVFIPEYARGLISNNISSQWTISCQLLFTSMYC